MSIGAQVLGSVQLFADGQPIDVGGPQQRRLLAMLLMSADTMVPTDRLMDVVWEGKPPDGANKTFHTYVAKLRRSIEASGDAEAASVIVTSPPGYLLAGDVLEIDAMAFEERLKQAQIDLEVEEAAAALETLDGALAMWRGPAYAEFADEEWAHLEAIRLDQLHVVARVERAQARLDLGLNRDVIPEVEALVGEHPLEERPRSQLMLALYRSGRHAEALRAYRDYAALLADETGLEPSSDLIDLEQMILDRDPRLDLQVTGRKLRGYLLGEQIGEGSLGVTYRATQPSVGREVAIKVIPEEQADDPTFVRRFEVEAQQVARIEHPHVVPLYDYWREPGGAYLVTRYMQGGSLDQRLADHGALDMEEATRVVDEVGGALLAAHERGVVHGDVIPANVLFDESGNAYLTGFGIASQDHAATVHDDVAGLGVVLMTMLTGRPFVGTDEVVDLRAIEAEASPELAAVAERALRSDPREGFTSIQGLLRAFHDVGGPAPTVAKPERRPITDQPNPYKGLYAFTEADARDFFGRDTLVDDLADHLSRHRFLGVVGPSGSGKSSVVRAGLVPKLRNTGAYVASMMPGTAPFSELEIALLRVATESAPSLLDEMRAEESGIARAARRVLPDEDNNLFLVIDQFEELFTLTDDAERDRFLTGLRYAVDEHRSRLRICVTARADFLDQILNHPTMGDLVRRNTVLVTPLNPDELHQAIVGPAERVGVAVEPALGTAMVADAHGAPGSLPLLQYALTETYDRRTNGTMTAAAYHQLGDLTGVLTQRADEIYIDLDPDGQHATRQLMSRLITPGEGTEDTRRRARRSELATIPDQVVDAYGEARLLSFDNDPATREPTVEVAHEALIQRWPRLRGWIDEDREGLRILRHLTAASADWEAADRDPSELYRGSRLAIADEWSTHHSVDLSPTEQEFLDESRALRDAEVESERRRIRRLRFLVTGFAVVAAIAIIAGLVALRQSQIADANASESELRRLIADSGSSVTDDPSRALLLAVEAHRISPSSETLGAVQRAVVGSPHNWLGDIITDRYYPRAEFLVDGDIVAISEEGIEVWDFETRTLLRQRAISGEPAGLDVSPDGSLIAVGAFDASWQLLDPMSLDVVIGGDAATGINVVRFAPGGDVIALGLVDGRVELRGIDDPGHDLDLPGVDDLVTDLSFSPDGGLIAAAADEGAPARQWNTATGEQIGPDIGPETAGRVGVSQVLYANGVLYAALRDIQAFDPATGQSVGPSVKLSGRLIGGSAELVPIGPSRLDIVGYGTAWHIDFDAETERNAGWLSTLDVGVGAVSRDGRVVVYSDGPGLSLWALDGAGLFVDAVVPRRGHISELSADGRLAITGGQVTNELGSTIWDVSGPVPEVLAAFEPGITLRLHGNEVVTNQWDGAPPYNRFDRWDSDTGAFRRLTAPGEASGGGNKPLFTPDGRFFIKGMVFDGIIEVFDVETTLPVARLSEFADEVPEGVPPILTDNAITPDGQHLVIASVAEHVAIYDIATWQLVDILEPDVGFLNIAFTPDGQLAITASARGVEYRDPSDLRVVLRGPVPDVALPLIGRTIEVFADGRLFKNGAQLWDVETMSPIGAAFPHDVTAWTPTLSVDTNRLGAQTEDELIVWHVDLETWPELACLAAGRNLTELEWVRFGPPGEYHATCEQWVTPEL